MCNLIPIEKKAQSAPGLPPGWTFVFCDKLGGKAIEDSEHFFGANFVTLEYLQILSSDKRQAFNRIGDAFGHFSEMLNIDTDGQMDRFCTQIGAHLARDEPDHPLVGRFFCQEWLGLDYRRRTLYGKIEKSARLEGGLHESIIYLKYDKNSLTNNRRRNLLNSKVQAIEPTEERVAYGAALKFEQLHGLKNDPLEATDLQDEVLLWRVPDMVTEETISVPGSNHKKMARLTIQIDRFLLTFTAKKSTIKNAGYGVFVSCVPLCGGGQEAEKFALRKGELVDIGIYSVSPTPVNPSCVLA